MRGREQEGPRTLHEDVAEVLRTGNVAAKDAHRLGHRPDLDGDATREAKVIHRPAAVAAQHARRVGIVHEDRRAVALGDLDDPGQRGDVPVHGEDPVRDDQDQAIRPAAVGPARFACLLQDGLEPRDVGVGIDLPGCLGQAHAIDDRGVVEGIGHDQVGFAGDGRNHTRIGRETALEREHGLGALERRELRFERFVQVHGAGDCADGTRSRPVLADRLDRRGLQARVVGQPEIVVRRQADDLASIDGGDGSLLGGHDPERAKEVLGVEIGQLIGKERERIRVRRRRHRIEPPRSRGIRPSSP